MGKKGIAGYIRIAKDDSSNSTETVDADECFRHDCTQELNEFERVWGVV